MIQSLEFINEVIQKKEKQTEHEMYILYFPFFSLSFIFSQIFTVRMPLCLIRGENSVYKHIQQQEHKENFEKECESALEGFLKN